MCLPINLPLKHMLELPKVHLKEGNVVHGGSHMDSSPMTYIDTNE